MDPFVEYAQGGIAMRLYARTFDETFRLANIMSRN